MKQNNIDSKYIGQGMGIGIVIGALIALIVNITTGDDSVWSYMIPIGVSMGVPIGIGLDARNKKKELGE